MFFLQKISKLVSIVTLIVLISNVCNFPISAHVLEKSDAVGGVMHITPDDDPIAKQVSTVTFELKDTQGTFDSDQCYCSLTVLQGESVVAVQMVPLIEQKESSTVLSYQITFPEKGVYQVQLTGQPVREAQFSEFRLKYDVRVEREAQLEQVNNEGQNGMVFPTILGFGIVTLIVILIIKSKDSL